MRKANWDCKHCKTVQAVTVPTEPLPVKKQYWDKRITCVKCKTQSFVIIYPDGKTGSTIVEHADNTHT